eukprot:853991-Pyramimonas_sp.AAC.1
MNFLKQGMAYEDFFPWEDDDYFLPRGEIFCPGMPPKGQSQRSEGEGVQNDVHMRTALNELHKAAPAMAPSGLAVSMSGSASGDVAIPVHVAPPSGAAASGGAAAPGGSAVSG